MLKTISRLELVLALNKSGLSLDLINKFPMERLLKLCNSLGQRQTPQAYYSKQVAIQKELCTDEQFFFYLEQAMEIEGMTPVFIDRCLSVIHANGKSAKDYPIVRFIASVAASKEISASAEAFYDYLTCFSYLFPLKTQAEVILTNLDLYRDLLDAPIVELPIRQYALFMDKALNNRGLLPKENDIKRTFSLLAGCDDLLKIIHFLHKNDIDACVGLENMESICANAHGALTKLETIHAQLGTDDFKHFMIRWIENYCPYFDLEVLCKCLIGEDNAEVKDVLRTRGGYINLIYGSRFKKVPLEDVNRYAEDILIYAITNKKMGFIRLVEQNYEVFDDIRQDSILFKREFYTKLLNINSLSLSNLEDLAWMSASKVLIDHLDGNKRYTFEEIKALYGLPYQYYKLYSALDIPRVDNRITALRQLSKSKLLSDIENEGQIKKLASMLSQKHLSKWREQNFYHIADLKAQDAVRLLVHNAKIGHLTPQMATRTDAMLVINNPDNALHYSSLEDMKNNLVKVDASWMKLIADMGLSDEFLHQHKNPIFEFLCNNGAAIAYTYLNNISNERRNSLKLIIKAELMGELHRLKYYADDLQKEIEYPVTVAQKSAWEENTELSNDDGIVVRECDDFFSTMLMGIVPQRTCLSYEGGVYKECLLSSFDSNKKVINAYKNGKVVGRAIARLTKGRFDKPENPNEASLSFVDLEKLTDDNEQGNSSGKERLIIFLERPYSAGVSNEVSNNISEMYIELLAKKADAMGAMLVLSNCYNSISNDDFVRTAFHVYISKSKAGAQYLDSLNGSATVSDEGGYRANSFYIHKDAVA
jgi:hypothetical protein